MLKQALGKVLLMAALGLVLLSTWASGAGTSAATVLKQNTSPRAEGMGEAHTALSDDESGALGWNPAGLYNAYRQEVGASFNRGLVDDAFGSLTYSQTAGDRFSLGGSLLFYDAGRLELNTADGESSQVAAERDVLGAVTGACRISLMEREVLFGANLKFIYSNLLESASAISLAADLGVMLEFKEIQDDLRLGIAVKNIGTPMKYLEVADPLPVQILAGVSCKPVKGGLNELTLAADGCYLPEGKLLGNLGAEYWREQTVALRAGYKISYDLDGFTLGLGIRCLGMQIDYAFGFMTALNFMHKLSVTCALGVDEKRLREVGKDEPVPETVFPHWAQTKPACGTTVMANLVEMAGK